MAEEQKEKIKKILGDLQTNDKTGLSDEEATKRVVTYGHNSVHPKHKPSKMRLAFQQLKPLVDVFRDSVWKSIPSEDLVPGDIVKMVAYCYIVADFAVVEYINGPVKVDQSALTGESLPATKNVGDTMYAGSQLIKGDVLGVVVATGESTFIGKSVLWEPPTKTVPKELKKWCMEKNIVYSNGDWMHGLKHAKFFIILDLDSAKTYPEQWRDLIKGMQSIDIIPIICTSLSASETMSITTLIECPPANEEQILPGKQLHDNFDIAEMMKKFDPAGGVCPFYFHGAYQEAKYNLVKGMQTALHVEVLVYGYGGDDRPACKRSDSAFTVKSAPWVTLLTIGFAVPDAEVMLMMDVISHTKKADHCVLC